MKQLWFILSIYVLLLSALPCADDDADAVPSPATISAVITHSEDADHHNEQCTPFCICACCQLSASTHHGFITSNSIALPSITHTARYRQTAYQLICFDFWQPPRIGNIV